MFMRDFNEGVNLQDYAKAESSESGKLLSKKTPGSLPLSFKDIEKFLQGLVAQRIFTQSFRGMRLEPYMMELNVVVRALVDVLVWGLNNSGTILNFEEMEVDELARTTGLGQLIPLWKWTYWGVHSWGFWDNFQWFLMMNVIIWVYRRYFN